jgi:putative acetyltransferase
MPPDISTLDISIRKATEKDAAEIIQVHYQAVHITAAEDYEQNILNEWSAFSEARIERLKTQLLTNPDKATMLVAELKNKIVGFGEIVPLNNELRAVYVSPRAARSGVGRTLLKQLEWEAAKVGVDRLWLDSSLTAAPFYLAHGYEIDERAEHELSSGRKMACIKMHKVLV